jgi:transposase, IS5 family
MDLWKIFILGAFRLTCNRDYDKLHEIANNHKKLRQMLGHCMTDDDYQYALQTLKDDISLFTPGGTGQKSIRLLSNSGIR